MFQAINVSNVFENCKDFLTSLYIKYKINKNLFYDKPHLNIMELSEWSTRKILVVIALAVIISVAALFVVMPQDQPEPKTVTETETVVETETETVVEKEEIVSELEAGSENTTVTETVTDAIPESPDIEIIEDSALIAEIPETPVAIPTLPEEIPSIPEKAIQGKVDRFNADPGTPVPEKGAAAGIVNKIHSGNVLELNNVLVKLRGVDTPNEDEPDFNQWREALMRICPVGSLALYDNPNRTPDSQGRISTNVWCYGYPNMAPLASANEVMSEADYDIIGRGCSISHDTRLLGCTR